ncbi:hypothetical protein [Streptomyces sp. PSAA01]|uniref:hypothetical protein n=1 Tax=Streptomyces sp. PSAA01 TaxID=2912762 RepID=UPI001F35DEE5|nr:hypothetical protein [Streptomyces sp. PSAA01]MCG0290974.1 hypothetical protein [Streptomyces sp. PSAA01]
MNTKLIKARRDVERLRMEAAGAAETEVKIWEAGNQVADLEAKERDGAVHTARTAGRAMDAVLLIVALLTMSFSLQNIHDFAARHAVQDPIAWFVAPAIDLALIAALLGDAVLSRWQLDAGPWATALRWYSGAATVLLNSWEAWAELDAAAIVLHTAMPFLLFVLAEAASPYRRGFAETVQLAAATVDTPAPAEVDTPPVVEVDSPAPADPAPEADRVYDQETDPAVSTKTPQDSDPEPLRSVPAPAEVDAPGERLDAKAARAAIETAWEEGLTVREAAVRATRASSYVGTVYAQLTKARGPQPIKGQTAIEDGEAA